MKTPQASLDILIINEGKILLGLLTKKWNVAGKRVYGIPGRDILFCEKIGEAVKRQIKEEFDCKVISYKIFCVNANYLFENHFIGIGVIVETAGEPKNLKPEDWEKWEWFDKDKIPTNIFPSAKSVIECYLKNKICVEE